LGSLCIWSHRTFPGQALARWKGFRRSLSSLAIFLLFFVGIESVFVLRGYESFVPAMAVPGEAGEPREVPGMTGDPEWLSRFLPRTVFYGRTLNQEGFPDADWAQEKGAKKLRAMCLGDSCAALGIPKYPEVLETVSSNEVECINLGTCGYSSEQGRRLWGLYGPRLKPDYVTIYFGWNDHWLADVPGYLNGRASALHVLHCSCDRNAFKITFLS
jgi:hypothetical protein